MHFIGGYGNDTLTTGKIAKNDADTLSGGQGKDLFNIVATTTAAEITDLGLGDDALIVSESAKGVVAKVINDYQATNMTRNDKATADVISMQTTG